MSKESIPQHNAHVLEEERKGIADSLAEQDTIRRCDAESSAAELKHEEEVQAKRLEYLHEQGKHDAKDLKHDAEHNAKNLKDAAKANAERLKL
ncbi:unnamed protein product [Adineta steineri]|uniref:Uncharacterized protein n=1 Tax=Adineta steineri TaxID=433720 RepID=A0A819C2V8_9BILA|nr:unnamed protein product [Adineta steineri]CAF0820570.1 unnamed protein product [Adineta steineri]CAF0903868.1 unnamed protein product [Adineta steineri]CAF0904617.1 unnamed protein product [Adineta steineri]CAF0950386.1 unnamed protein product [Adineta steineri]